MTPPFALKHSRLAVLLCLALEPAGIRAAPANWNCEKSANGKDWVCVSKDGKGDSREEASPSAPETDARKEPVEAAPRPERAAPSVPPEAPAPLARKTIPRAAPEPSADLPEPAPAPKADDVAEKPAISEPGPPITDAPAAEPMPEPPVKRRTEPREPAIATRMGRAPEQSPRVKDEPENTPSANRRSGWSCEPGEAGKEWNCALVGSDPRGEAHPPGTESIADDWREAGDITSADEQRFRNVISLLPADPWQNACAGRRETAPMTQFLVSSADREAREKAPLDIHSDYFEMLDDELANFRGSAELVKGDQKLWADFVTHDTVTDAMNARGNMIYQEKGMTFAGDSGFLDMDSSRGTFRNAQFILSAIPSRGTARVAHLDNDKLSRYETFSYTSCPPGNQDWQLHASRVKINKETGQGSATNAWMEFKGVPFFYFPYMSFPVDDRRQTGFLTPSFGTTKVGGFDLTLPYYFNLAPNYDFTLTPRYLTKRGPLFAGEFRYLTDWTRGRTMLEYLPEDQLRGTSRGQAGFLNDTRILPNLTTHVDANYVSDYRYPRELGNPLNLTSYLYAASNANINYSLGSFNLRADANYYQAIGPNFQYRRYPRTPEEAAQKAAALASFPYYSLPKVTASYAQELWGTGLMFEGIATAANFLTDGERTTGQRLNIRPRIYYPYQNSAGFITPSVTLNHTQYWLDQVANTGLTFTNIGSKSISRTLPTLSLDSGLFFERDFEFAGSPMVQTLEPRFFYVYTPYQNQNQIPLFDTGQYDFTYYQLFRENRFSNTDRIGDANQATVSITSRIIDQTSGLDRLRLSLGEIFYFSPQRVPLFYSPIPNDPSAPKPNPNTFSNFVADSYLGITNNWSMRAGGQWNPERTRFERGILALQYNDRENHLLNLAYRYRRDQNLDTYGGVPGYVDQTLSIADASARIPIFKGWNLIGRWQYSTRDQLTLETFAGIERETCCWRFTLLGRRYINNFRPGVDLSAVDIQYNNGIFLQLELKGLTRLGHQVDQFLERSISGYETVGY